MGRIEFLVDTHDTVVPASDKQPELQNRPDWNITANRPVTGQRILDIGCGTGGDVLHLTAGNQVVGLDVSAKSLHWAQKHGLQVFAGDAERSLPFSSAQFDLLVIKDVFEHLLNPTALLQEAYRVLKPGGTLVANVPNHFYLLIRLRMLGGKGLMWKTPFGDHTQFYQEWNYQHVRFFTWPGFQQFLAQAAWSDIEYVWELGELLYHPRDEILARFDHEEFTMRRFSPILGPLVRLFFVMFPRSLRVALARWRPGLFAAAFYARCTKP